METLNNIDIIKLFKSKAISLFTLADFGRLTGVENQNTLYKKIQRLEKHGIVKKLQKGKYLFLFAKSDDFKLANFLCQPSYISLESALSFFGIITDFSYKITSVTIKKTRNFTADEKEFSYSQIDRKLFWGFKKADDFLIAEPEKAVLDYLYFAFKGLRSPDLSEFDFSQINKSLLKKYLKKIKMKRWLKFIQKMRI